MLGRQGEGGREGRECEGHPDPYSNQRYEAEFFKNQLQLEADRQAEASHAKLLQV